MQGAPTHLNFHGYEVFLETIYLHFRIRNLPIGEKPCPLPTPKNLQSENSAKLTHTWKNFERVYLLFSLFSFVNFKIFHRLLKSTFLLAILIFISSLHPSPLPSHIQNTTSIYIKFPSNQVTHFKNAARPQIQS